MSPRKANRPSLDPKQIVAAALALIDETGLEGHTMRALGARLGVDASTLYYHLPSKSALHSLIVDEMMSGLDLSKDDPSLSTAERVVAAAAEFRRALMLHPRALPLVAARSMRTETQLAGIEVLLGIFYGAGFSPIEAMVAVDGLGQTIIGISSIHAAHLEAEQWAEEQPFAELPPERFPNVVRMLEEGAYIGFEAEFDTTIRALVDGVLARQQAGTLLPPDAAPVRLTHPDAPTR